jgi:chromosome segregation ATPase
MRKTVLAAMLFVGLEALSQTPAKQSDTLQSLLLEVRQLRQDIEAITAASQRVQIAISAMQLQDAAVARSSQRVDELRSKCNAAELNRQHTTFEIQRLENALGPGATPGREVPEREMKDLQSRIEELKSGLAGQSAEVESCQAGEAEASNQLRTEQAALADLRGRVERLDKALAASGVR